MSIFYVRKYPIYIRRTQTLTHTYDHKNKSLCLLTSSKGSQLRKNWILGEGEGRQAMRYKIKYTNTLLLDFQEAKHREF